MGYIVLICCLALLFGCQSQDPTRDHARIMRGLEKRVTAEEARGIVLADLDNCIAEGRAMNTDESRKEAQLSTQIREIRNSKLDSFFARRRTGDEIWVYRTYATPDRRGGQR